MGLRITPCRRRDPQCKSVSITLGFWGGRIIAWESWRAWSGLVHDYCVRVMQYGGAGPVEAPGGIADVAGRERYCRNNEVWERDPSTVLYECSTNPEMVNTVLYSRSHIP